MNLVAVNGSKLAGCLQVTMALIHSGENLPNLLTITCPIIDMLYLLQVFGIGEFFLLPGAFYLHGSCTSCRKPFVRAQFAMILRRSHVLWRICVVFHTTWSLVLRLITVSHETCFFDRYNLLKHLKATP